MELNKKLKVLFMCVTVTCLFLSGCKNSSQNFEIAYEQSNEYDMIHSAVLNDLLLDVGFTYNDSDFGSFGTSIKGYQKDYNNVKLSYWQ